MKTVLTWRVNVPRGRWVLSFVCTLVRDGMPRGRALRAVQQTAVPTQPRHPAHVQNAKTPFLSIIFQVNNGRTHGETR
jgi:hypothetical protein